MALMATGFPRITLMVRLSKRSVLLIAFQFLYSGMNATPFGSAATCVVRPCLAIHCVYVRAGFAASVTGAVSIGVR